MARLLGFLVGEPYDRRRCKNHQPGDAYLLSFLQRLLEILRRRLARPAAEFRAFKVTDLPITVRASLAVAYPAATPFPIGASLMQVTLSPQEAADLLFYLMNVMSTVSASTTTPSTETTSFSIEEVLTNCYGLERAP